MFYSFEAKRKINAILDEFRPDLVHIHNIYHQMSPTILFEIKKRNIPIVMTVHDYKLINPNHSLILGEKPYRRCERGRYYQCFLDKCVKNSYAKSLLAALEMYWHGWLGTYSKNIDLYIAPSNFVKKILVKWGMPKSKIIVLPHFIPLSKQDEKRYSFSVAEKYAIYPGKISREKGVDTLVDIFKGINGMRLYLAGEIEDDFEIPAHPNVKYLGFLNADQLKEYMKNSKCVVSGSKLPETFGLIAMEAIAAGKPFAGFDSGAYSEVINDGSVGHIARGRKDFSEFLRRLCENKIVFDRQHILDYSRKYAAKKYYESLLGIFIALSGKK